MYWRKVLDNLVVKTGLRLGLRRYSPVLLVAAAAAGIVSHSSDPLHVRTIT